MEKGMHCGAEEDGSVTSVCYASMRTSQVQVPAPAQEARGPVTPASWGVETGGLLQIASHHLCFTNVGVNSTHPLRYVQHVHVRLCVCVY